MREICLAKLDKTRPVVILTRELARAGMNKVTVIPITSTIKGLSSEVLLGKRNGLDHECVAAIDNTTTIPTALLGRTIGYLTAQQEKELAKAMVLAFDLEVPILSL